MRKYQNKKTRANSVLAQRPLFNIFASGSSPSLLPARTSTHASAVAVGGTLRKGALTPTRKTLAVMRQKDMRKRHIILTFLFASILACGQGPTELTIVNKDCPSYKGVPFIVDELKVTAADLSNYLKEKYPNHVNLAALEINLVFGPESQLCCREITLIDQRKFSKSQREILLKHIMTYSGFTNAKVITPRRLRIFVTFDERHKIGCSFLGK